MMRFLFALSALLALPVALHAQRIGAAIHPDTITVGDPALAAVRLELPAGFEAVFPDTLDIAGDLENTGPREIGTEVGLEGVRVVTVTYPFTAWRPGDQVLPPLAVELVAADGGTARIEARPGAFHVASVLPADTAGVRPRPPKDVLGGERSLAWLWLLAAVLALLALAAWLYYRRRRSGAVDAAPAAPPRERALAALEEARAGGLVEAARYREFYTLLGDALRHYQAGLAPSWGVDLTTGELIGRMSADPRVGDLSALGDVLRRADLVKFARRATAAAEAWADWEAARDWVLAFDWPPPEAEPSEPVREVA
jgi:hypothetical protein